jgi:hypothetical protein
MWMPCRDEFQITFCDSAEQTVASMQFTEDDTEETFNAKVSVLVGYNALIAVRQKMDREVEKWGIQENNMDDAVSTTTPAFLPGAGWMPERWIRGRTLLE